MTGLNVLQTEASVQRLGWYLTSKKNKGCLFQEISAEIHQQWIKLKKAEVELSTKKKIEEGSTEYELLEEMYALTLENESLQVKMLLHLVEKVSKRRNMPWYK